MKMLVVFIGLVSLMTSNAYAAVWIKLHENNASKLMLDKQSILQKDQLKRVWVKIEYKNCKRIWNHQKKNTTLASYFGILIALHKNQQLHKCFSI